MLYLQNPTRNMLNVDQMQDGGLQQSSWDFRARRHIKDQPQTSGTWNSYIIISQLWVLYPKDSIFSMRMQPQNLRLTGRMPVEFYPAPMIMGLANISMLFTGCMIPLCSIPS